MKLGAKKATASTKTVARGRPTKASLFTSTARDKEARRRARTSIVKRRLPGLSVLETANVKWATLEDYRRRMWEFVEWSWVTKLDWDSDAGLDTVLVAFFDQKYIEGAPADDGAKTMAALQFMLPRYGRNGSGHLPRAARALRAWRKHGPSRQRLPLPMVLLALILRHMLDSGSYEMAVAVLLQHKMYLRPGELVNLKKEQLVPPVLPGSDQYGCWAVNLAPEETGPPGKTGLHDESLVLDTSRWLGLHLSMFQDGDPDAPLWSFTYNELVMVFQHSVKAVGLGHLGASLYSNRHGGASEDLRRKERSWQAVKARGRWRSEASVRRYGKEAKLLTELKKVPQERLEMGELAERNLKQSFMDGRQRYVSKRRLDMVTEWAKSPEFGKKVAIIGRGAIGTGF